MTKNLMLHGASRRSILKQAGAAAVGISFGAGLAGCAPAAPSGPTVHFLNWDTYIGPTTLADFTTATHTPVKMDLFASNDELFAKFRAGNPGYDVIVPSNEYVTRMAEAQMLMPLDKTKIPNFANLLPEFKDAGFDPGRRYSMPYTWLVIGVGYRKSKMVGKVPGGVPDSWKYLLDSGIFHQKVSVLGESADLIRISAKYLGHSVNGVRNPLIILTICGPNTPGCSLMLLLEQLCLRMLRSILTVTTASTAEPPKKPEIFTVNEAMIWQITSSPPIISVLSSTF